MAQHTPGRMCGKRQQGPLHSVVRGTFRSPFRPSIAGRLAVFIACCCGRQKVLFCDQCCPGHLWAPLAGQLGECSSVRAPCSTAVIPGRGVGGGAPLLPQWPAACCLLWQQLGLFGLGWLGMVLLLASCLRCPACITSGVCAQNVPWAVTPRGLGWLLGGGHYRTMYTCNRVRPAAGCCCAHACSCHGCLLGFSWAAATLLCWSVVRHR